MKTLLGKIEVIRLKVCRVVNEAVTLSSRASYANTKRRPA